MKQSKNVALNSMKSLSTYRYMLSFLTSHLDEISELFGGDPWPYGVESNCMALETLVNLFHDQAMISRRIAVEELFVPCKYE